MSRVAVKSHTARVVDNWKSLRLHSGDTLHTQQHSFSTIAVCEKRDIRSATKEKTVQRAPSGPDIIPDRSFHSPAVRQVEKTSVHIELVG